MSTASPRPFTTETATGPALSPDAVGNGFRAAIEAATRFVGATAPNPPVGCAVLDETGTVLAAAAHQRAGQPHAEALALRATAEAGLMARALHMIVTLEPCNHHGRTGPCTDAILASPIRHVWIGTPDPNTHVAGGGAMRLQAAGLSVRWLDRERGSRFLALGDECRALIAPFARVATGGRPWLTVKQALDRNASMLPPPGARTFTSPDSLRLAHRLRRMTDAIVTGTGTLRADAPDFTVRHLPDHAGRRRLLAVIGSPANLSDDYRRAAEARGFTLRLLPDPDALPAALAEAGVLWAMVEAGPRLLDSLHAAGLWDDWLRIEQTDGPDRLSVALSSHTSGVTPLRLLPELSPLPGGLDPASVRPAGHSIRISP